MKRFLLSLSIIIIVATNTSAQDIYNEIRNNSLNVVSSPTSNQLMKQINQFKVDALDYLLIKMREEMPDSTTTFLDKQALAMNNFVNYYVQCVVKYKDQPDAYQIKITELFMNVSISNPLFKDKDRELTLTYFAKGDCLTRFSLDTDWRRAVVAVYTEMGNIKD